MHTCIVITTFQYDSVSTVECTVLQNKSICLISLQLNGRCLLQGIVLINRRYLTPSYDSDHDVESVEHQVAVQQ